jgi:hypothetical protein
MKNLDKKTIFMPTNKMNSKAILCLMIILSSMLVCFSAEWKVTLKVVDDNGQLVADAKVGVGYYEHSQPASIDGLTDKNGIFKASHNTPAIIAELGFGAEKAGYYTTRAPGIVLRNYDQYSDLSKWNITQTIVLKKIFHPIPMYANKVDIAHEKKPAFDKPLGFDLAAGDWVAPYGKGKTTHMFFMWHVDHDTNDYESFGSRKEFGWETKMIISFPNPGDGIQEFDMPGLTEGSELRSPQIAPTNGYLPQLFKHSGWHPNRQYTKSPDTNSYDSYDHLHKNYLLRVSTVLDGQGNVKSAQYGKIYGDFEEVVWMFLNPETNSLDLEFDPTHNLGRGGSSGWPIY